MYRILKNYASVYRYKGLEINDRENIFFFLSLKLIHTLRLIVLLYNKKTHFYTYCTSDTGKIHVVMTKYDLVKKQHEYDSTDNDTISEDDYREIEDEVANLFSIDGNRSDNLTRLTSYSDRINPENDNPAVDKGLLKLIRQIMTPGNAMVTDRINVMTVPTKIDLAVRKWFRNLNFNSAQFLCLALVSVLAIILFWILSRPT